MDQVFKFKLIAFVACIVAGCWSAIVRKFDDINQRRHRYLRGEGWNG
jgi:hypothetical protein